MSEENKKSLFDRAIDALTDRDEKETRPEGQSVGEPAGTGSAPPPPPAAGKERRRTAVNVEGGGVQEKQKPAGAGKGLVRVRSLRIRADHNTAAEVVGGLVNGDEVEILSTWTDGTDTWAKLPQGWAAMIYDGETYITSK